MFVFSRGNIDKISVLVGVLVGVLIIIVFFFGCEVSDKSIRLLIDFFCFLFGLNCILLFCSLC